MASTLQNIVDSNCARSNSAGRANLLDPIYRVESAVAAVALVCVMPLLLFIATMTALLSRQAPLVRHRRMGWRGSPLGMLKFRTMWNRDPKPGAFFAIEDISDCVPLHKTDDDPRVTSHFARWCRRYSLDELPQLYHVARGQMSLVGPRPITATELAEHYGSSTQEVLSLRPGLTGLWQSMGRSRLTYAARRRLDVWFIRHASPGLYFRILARTIPRVMQGSDAH